MKPISSLLAPGVVAAALLFCSAHGEGGGEGGSGAFFSASKNDFLKRQGQPPNQTFEVQTRQYVQGSVATNVRDYDPTTATAQTVVSLSVGDVTHSASLAEDPSWTPGKRVATFEIKAPNIGDGGGGDRILARFKYQWSSTRLSVTFSGTAIGSIVADDYYGSEQKFYVPVAVSVGIGEFLTDVTSFAKGKARIVNKEKGGQQFSLNKVSLVSKSTPPPPQ